MIINEFILSINLILLSETTQKVIEDYLNTIVYIVVLPLSYILRYYLGILFSWISSLYTPRSIRGEWKTTFIKRGKFLFIWEKIQEDEDEGSDNNRLKNFLDEKYNIDLITNEKIEIAKNTIKIFTKQKFLLLQINDEKTKVTLTIDGIMRDEFIVLTENGALCIYNGKTYIEFATVYQLLKYVFGVIKYYPDAETKEKERIYRFFGTLNCNILVATYTVLGQPSIVDRGSFTLQMENTGEHMKGWYSWTDDEKSTILGDRYEWQRIEKG